jgi:translation initiation factor 2B subunit (eIF-2B alpha/beta/delta family)
MNIPSNFSLEEALRELDLSSDILIILEQANQVHFDIVYDLQEELKASEEELEKLQKVQKNAKNLVSWFEQELLCKDFRYKETKNLVKKLLSLIETHNLEV